MNDIEKTLNTPKKKTESIEDQDESKPRNYHPPDSPVRRIFENGVEITPQVENCASQTRAESMMSSEHKTSVAPTTT